MSTLTPPPSPEPVAPAIASPSCPAIVFQIAGQWLALPYAALLRVVHRSAVNQPDPSGTLAYLGKHPVGILNLAAFLTNAPQSDSIAAASNLPFLVVAAVETAMVGIPVNQLPILLDLPLAQTHVLPPNYYKAIYGIASHGITLPQLGTVLLLNLAAVMSDPF